MADPQTSTLLQWAPALALAGVVVGATVGALAGWLTARQTSVAALNRLTIELDQRRQQAFDDRRQTRIEATYVDLLTFLHEHAVYLREVHAVGLAGGDAPKGGVTDEFAVMGARVEVFASTPVRSLVDDYFEFARERTNLAREMWQERQDTGKKPQLNRRTALVMEMEDHRATKVNRIIDAVRRELGTDKSHAVRQRAVGNRSTVNLESNEPTTFVADRDELYGVALDEALRGLAVQKSDLEHVRNRALALAVFSGASAASLTKLIADGTSRGHTAPWPALAICVLTLLGVVVGLVAIVRPQELTFRNEPYQLLTWAHDYTSAEAKFHLTWMVAGHLHGNMVVLDRLHRWLVIELVAVGAQLVAFGGLAAVVS